MGILPFLLIMASTLLSVSWNTLAKKSRMTAAFYAIVCLTSNMLWWHVFFWTPLPIREFPMRFWLFLISSAAFDFCYCFGMVGAYRRMDMSAAYPVMRALPILLTAAGTELFGVGRELSVVAVLGMFVAFAGCLTMPLNRFSDFNIRSYMTWGMFFLLLNALGTSGYTIVDSLAQKVLMDAEAGAGVGKPVISMTFYVLRGGLMAGAMTAYVLLRRDERGMWLGFFRERNLTPVFAGLFSSSTYILLLIATNYVDNVSYIQIFRQLGMVFSLPAGIFILREKCTPTRVAGVALIISGMIMAVMR